MTVWFKQGVVGCLHQHAQKAFGRVAEAYSARGHDFHVTSLRDGNHSPGSFHYTGNAFDFRKALHITKEIVQDAAGPNCDVIEHSTHFHVEYDPK